MSELLFLLLAALFIGVLIFDGVRRINRAKRQGIAATDYWSRVDDLQAKINRARKNKKRTSDLEEQLRVLTNARLRAELEASL